MPRRSELTLTKKLVDSLTGDPGRDYFVWDRELTGFGVRVKESGAKAFVIKYRTLHARQRKITLGKYGALTVDQARKAARIQLGRVANGEDPVLEIQRQRDGKTISELCDLYFEDATAGNVLHRGKPKKASTLAIDRGRIERHIKPLLGSMRVDELTRTDAQDFMHAVRDGKTAIYVKTGKRGRANVRGGVGTAKKALSLLSAIYTYAVKQNLVDDNPCRYVERPADNKRDRFLKADEYRRLGQALKDATNEGLRPTFSQAIQLLLLTGYRHGEVVNLKRSEVDLSGRCIRFEDTKAGAQIRPCGTAALSLLEHALKSHDREWIFPSDRAETPIANVRKPLSKICNQAGLEDVTPHVFRHSFATVAHELGYSELTIAGLLGHRLSSVTSRYAHNVDHAIADAADKVSRAIWERIGYSDEIKYL